MAATKALDMLFDVEPSSVVKKLRELFYSSFYVTDHTVHFYALGGPDFVLGPDSNPAERNILGVIHKVGVDIGVQVIECRKRNHEVIDVDGARVLFGDGWGLLRTSNTQPVIVTRYEARTEERLKEIQRTMEDWLATQGVHA